MTSQTFAMSSIVTTAETSPPRRGRSLAAIGAGLACIFVVTTATDVVMHATGVFPGGSAPGARAMKSSLFLLAFAYRLVFDIGGCWLTARLAPSRPMRHALVLGLVGLVLSVVGALLVRGAGPVWYPLALAASSLPSAWAGGKIARGTGKIVQSRQDR